MTINNIDVSNLVGGVMDGALDGVARRLDAAADELADMKAALARHELALDRSGRGAREVAGALESAWTAHLDHFSRLTAGLTGLAASVRLAGTTYRATDSVLADARASSAGVAGPLGAAHAGPLGAAQAGSLGAAQAGSLGAADAGPFRGADGGPLGSADAGPLGASSGGSLREAGGDHGLGAVGGKDDGEAG